MRQEGLEQAKSLIQIGKRHEAGLILARLLKDDLTNAEVWYTFAQCVEEEEYQIECLHRALRYRPDYVDAQTALSGFTSVVSAGRVRTSSDLPPLPTAKPETVVRMATSQQQTPKMTTKVTLADPVRVQTHSRPAGDSTTKIAEYYSGMNKVDQFFFYLFFIFFALSVLTIIFAKNTHWWSYLIFALLGIFAFKQVIDAFEFEKDSRLKKYTYAKGAIGELEVGRILDSLGPNFCVWHDFPSAHGNIDHIVLSKKGRLFMVETKAHSGEVTLEGGKLLLNGRAASKDMIKQCLNNLYDLKNEVKERTGKDVWVSPILVFTNAFVHYGAPIRNIRVVNKGYLIRVIQEINSEGGREALLWKDINILDDLFSSGENQSVELHNQNFERIAGWGKGDFAERRSQKGA